jgi:hypothetical protein
MRLKTVEIKAILTIQKSFKIQFIEILGVLGLKNHFRNMDL